MVPPTEGDHLALHVAGYQGVQFQRARKAPPDRASPWKMCTGQVIRRMALSFRNA